MAIFMTTGIIWEVAEYLLSTGWDHDFWSELSINIFWDLWVNLAGYRCGEWWVCGGGVEEGEEGEEGERERGEGKKKKKRRGRWKGFLLFVFFFCFVVVMGGRGGGGIIMDINVWCLFKFQSIVTRKQSIHLIASKWHCVWISHASFGLQGEGIFW